MKILPDEIYNLAAQSHVKVRNSLKDLFWITRIYFWCRRNGICPAPRGGQMLQIRGKGQNLPSFNIFDKASTSEMFGDFPSYPQNEETPLHPCSPYG